MALTGARGIDTRTLAPRFAIAVLRDDKRQTRQRTPTVPLLTSFEMARRSVAAGNADVIYLDQPATEASPLVCCGCWRCHFACFHAVAGDGGISRTPTPHQPTLSRSPRLPAKLELARSRTRRPQPESFFISITLLVSFTGLAVEALVSPLNFGRITKRIASSHLGRCWPNAGGRYRFALHYWRDKLPPRRLPRSQYHRPCDT